MKLSIRRNAIFVLLLLTLVGNAHAQPRVSVRLENPFARAHRRQPVQSVLTVSKQLLPSGSPLTIESLNRYVALMDEATGKLLPVQWSDLQPVSMIGSARATANYITDLPGNTTRVLKLVGPRKEKMLPSAPILVTQDKKQKFVEVRTGRLGVRLASAGSQSPPLMAVCKLPNSAGDGARISSAKLSWRGRSIFGNTAPLEHTNVVHSTPGPVFYRQTNTYRFATGTIYRCTITCWAGLDYLTVQETTSGPASERMRWMFDLGDWPTHVYSAGHGATQKLVYRRHSSAYLDFPLAELEPGKEFLWLPNYLIWSRFEEASLANFLRSAAGSRGKPPFEPDMLTIFQIRRGDWEDKLWAARARRPLGDFPWRPWSQRRWWGSRYSTIRVARNGHPKSGALLKFSLAPGSREWGLWMGDSGTLPPARKMVLKPLLPSDIKTAAGEVRLTELQHYIFDWRNDPKVVHPRMEMTPAMLRAMMQKAKTDPYFASTLEGLQKNAALRAVLDKDRKAANAIARGILGDMNTRFNFPLNDGFEFTSHFTPVGIRPLYQYASTIDLLLGEKDLLEPEIQKQFRHRFVYLAYLLADTTFMAHRYNAGHPNFDADRYVALAGIAMLYPDHPHSQQWLDSAVGSLREAMRVYVIPKSGKWAENLGGYYNWSTNIIGGMARALKHTGAADPYAWPEFQNFWRWGLVTALPPKPSINALGGETAAAKLPRIRQTAGIGDNGGDGGLNVHGGFALAGANMLQHNPQLGRQLLWLWNQGGRSGYGHYPYALYFGLTAEHSRLARDPRSAPKFTSRLLEGYGSIFRADFNRPSESYLLFKCGPGGYRYHGEEGSMMLFGNGQPLSLDGGTAFRPEQHSTVTFGKANAGLLRGRIVQFESTPQLDYVCGRFPGTPEQLGNRKKTNVSDVGLVRLVATGSEPSSEPAKIVDHALHQDGDVMNRQILFRKNDYVVIRDRIDSVQEARWRLLLLADEIRRQKQRLNAHGPLGMNVAVTIFQSQPGNTALQSVPTQRIVIDQQPLKQQRLTLPLTPGTGLVAVVDFYKQGQQPWRVTAKGAELVFRAPQGNITEIVELNGESASSARWLRLQGGKEIAAWSSSQYDDPWIIPRPAVIKAGDVYVAPPRPGSGAEETTLLSVAGIAKPLLQARDELILYREGISAFQTTGSWNMVALGQQRLGVLESDPTGGLHYRELRDSKTPAAMKGRVQQALNNKLPTQIALIRTGNTPRHAMVSLLARRTLSLYSGYAVQELTTRDVLSGRLKDFPAAVLLQASAADVNDELQVKLREFVNQGGTLLCDMPSLPSKDGRGTTSQWSQFLGITYGTPNPRGRFAIRNKQLGYVELRTAEEEILKLAGGNDLGHWFLQPTDTTRVVRDASNRITITVHPVGKGKVITFCFRLTSVGADSNNQVYLEKLLKGLLAETDLQPLIDAPWVEKTILPQNDGGQLIIAHNPRSETIHVPLRFPHHSAAKIAPIYVPPHGAVQPDHLVLPPRGWIVFGVD